MALDHADVEREQEPAGVRRDRWSVLDKVLALFTAVLTLATAATGLFAASAVAERNDLAQVVDDSGTERQELADELETAKKRVEDLEGELADRTSSSSTTAPTSDTTEPTGEGDVFRTSGATPVPFATYYGIDLDSTATDWGVAESAPEHDLRFVTQTYPGTHLRTAGRSKISLVDHPPTKAECDANTVLQDVLTPAQTRQGTQMCVLTSEGRFAYVKIAALDQANGTISLDITVWN